MLFYIFFLILIFSVIILGKSTNKQNIKKSYGLQNEIIDLQVVTRKNNLLLIAFILLFCMSAFRFNIGWDYWAYYDTIRYGLESNIISRDEYASILLINLSKYTGITNLFFFINSFICIFLIYKTIKTYSTNPWLSLIFFLCFPLLFLNSLSVIRFFTALSITFYGFKYILEKKMLKYLFLVVLASLFHKSALIALIFYFVRYIKLDSFKLFLILITTPFIGGVVNSIVVNFLPKYKFYTQVTQNQEGTKAIIFFVALAFISIMLMDKITKNDEVAKIYLNSFILGVAIYLMFYSQGTMGHRLSLYGTIYSLLLVSKIISLFNHRIERVFIEFLFCLLLVAMFIYTLITGAYTYIPYRTIFEF